MKQLQQDLETLCLAAGFAGHNQIAAIARELLEPLTDEIRQDAMGNLLAVRHGSNPAAPTVLLEAHMDEIGFLVTGIDELGFVHVAAAGGIDARVLAAQPVVVYGKEKEYAGVFCSVPPHLSKNQETIPTLSETAIDLGMTQEQARSCIQLGDRVGFSPKFDWINSTVVSSKALDDRSGMAAILYCLRHLPPLPVHVAVSFCVQEELGCRGCAVAARQLAPSLALVTDVSFAMTAGEDAYSCGRLGEGPMIGISPVLDQKVSERLFKVAEENNIAVQTEVMGGSTGTDADNISKEINGIPTGLLSIPLRYMHTPVETMDVKDIEAVGALMCACVADWGREYE